ncbi:MAG: hypothetical protein IKT14_05490, partial [Clostridiales bacterium]|nr:hypothetical protein [Clostridiales bacterium]
GNRKGGYNNRDKKKDFRSRNQDQAPKPIHAEETIEDIKRENDRLEKEIWIDIAEIHTIKLE